MSQEPESPANAVSESTGAEDAPPAGDTTQESSPPAEMSFEAALAEAKAEREQSAAETPAPEGEAQKSAAETLDDIGDGTAKPDAQPAEGAEGQQDQEHTPPTDETAIDQIEAVRQKVADGKYNELTPQERALYSAVESNVRERMDFEQRIHDEYIRLYDLYENDQQAFLQEMADNPDRYAAFVEYGKAYPNAHEDGARPQKTEKQIRDEVRGEYSSAVRDTAQQIATEMGLPSERVSALQKEHGTKLGAFLTAATNEAAEAKAKALMETERPKIAEAERQAVTQELEAKYMERNAVRLPASGTATDPAKQPKPEPTNIYEAYEQAKEVLGR